MARGAFVAGVGVLEGDAKVFAKKGDVALGEVAERGEHADAFVGAGLDGGVYGRNEAGAAIGVDGVVAGVVGDEDGVKAVAFGKAGGHGKHYAVAERHDGALHIALVIFPVGDRLSTLEDAALEILPYEFQGNNHMPDSQPLAVGGRARRLRLVLPCAICESHRQGNFAGIFVQHHRAVHPAGIYQYRLHTVQNYEKNGIFVKITT